MDPFDRISLKEIEEMNESPAIGNLTITATSPFIAAKLGIDLESEQSLDKRIQQYQTANTEQAHRYLEASKRERKIKDYTLSFLCGWSTPATLSENPLLADQARKCSGGYYLRWNGKGIAINPGPDFLDYFDKQGLFISDIDYVIVTKNNETAHEDIQKIYNLNYQLNKISADLHVIHYYLNHTSYQQLSHVLKPNFKQERNTVHSLELFLDSQDVEKEELAEGITLHYFAISPKKGYTTDQNANKALGIKLDLTLEKTGEKRTIGYLSGTTWEPSIPGCIGSCNLLIAGFGNTNSNDYGKLGYNETCLGYYGLYTLLEEVKPSLLLCSEFEGREGDIRLEIIKKLRAEYKTAQPEEKVGILPSDQGLTLNLAEQKIVCSISGELLDPVETAVIKTSDSFGKLHYLARNSIL